MNKIKEFFLKYIYRKSYLFIMLKICNFCLKNFAITDNQYSTYLIQNSFLKVFLYSILILKLFIILYTIIYNIIITGMLIIQILTQYYILSLHLIIYHQKLKVN